MWTNEELRTIEVIGEASASSKVTVCCVKFCRWEALLHPVSHTDTMTTYMYILQMK